MSAKDNLVYNTTLSLGNHDDDRTIPEETILGYVKLMLMKESSLQVLLSGEERRELEQARHFLEDKQLDLQLLRVGLPQIVGMFRNKGNSSQAETYRDYLASVSGSFTSKDILEKSLSLASLPICKIFAKGNTLAMVNTYMDSLKPGKTEEWSSEKESTFSKEETEEETSKSEEAGSGKTVIHKPTSNNYFELSEYYRILTAKLLDAVKGQDDAVARFVEGCFQGQVVSSEEHNNRPRAHFMFFGPPGTGKTFLAETAANFMELPFFKLDVSVLTEESFNKMLQFVKKNPECLLLVDEVEKHSQAQQLFLGILGSGECSNIDFRQAIIIFTSNLGKSLYENRRDNLTILPSKIILSAMMTPDEETHASLTPEFCSRLATGKIIAFNHLKLHHLVEMADSRYREYSLNMQKKYGWNLSYEKELPMLFLYHLGDDADARMVSGESSGFLKSEVYEFGRQLVGMKKKTDISIANAHIGIDWNDCCDEEIRKLFFNDSHSEVLILADPKLKESICPDENRYLVHWATNLTEAKEMLKYDITAAFIDPLWNPHSDNSHIMSLADYDTDGVKFFHYSIENSQELALYIIDHNKVLSPADQRTFIQEGAFDTVILEDELPEAFLRHFAEIMDELYMEVQSMNFFSQGWVIDYKTKQDITAGNGNVLMQYYDLTKKKAVDLDSMQSVLSETERPKVHFDDVIGARTAKKDLTFYVDFLKNPKAFIARGNKVPHGVLLYGPPGTGKTMLARAMAGESDVTFISTTAANFKNKYVGESEANVRRIFARARKYAPSVIFIDEIDAVGKQRTGGETGRHTEELLNALLTEMDGFDSLQNVKHPVFVLAATNFGVRDGEKTVKLDDALLRRFDKKIYVDLPEKNDRLQYIHKQLGKIKGNEVSEDVVNNIADRSTGMSLAILENILGAAVAKESQQEPNLTDKMLLDAFDEYEFGDEKIQTRDYYERVAHHEMGHAYVSYKTGFKTSHITIESRGDHGGYVMPGEEENRTGYTREELLSRIRICMAGRAAEEVFYGTAVANNTGASSDLMQATNYAFHILCTYGMEEGQLMVMSREEVMKSSLAGEYVAKVNQLLQTEYQNAVQMIQEGRTTLQTLADALLETNQMTGGEFERLMEKLEPKKTV